LIVQLTIGKLYKSHSSLLRARYKNA